jgi:putative transposase
MIDRNHDLSIKRQTALLGICRGTAYYRPRPGSDVDLQIMRRIDRIHTDYPTAGARMLRDLLRREGFSIGRRHVTTLMRRMGLEAIYRKPRTSDKLPGHKVFPYLLRDLKIVRANQVWAMDTTYSTPRQRSRPAWRQSCLSMFGMQRSMEVKLQ